MIYSCYHL